MKFTVDRRDYEDIPRKDLEDRLGILTWLLVNECMAKGGSLQTAPLSNEVFGYKVLLVGEGEDYLIPNKPATLRVEDKIDSVQPLND